MLTSPVDLTITHSFIYPTKFSYKAISPNTVLSAWYISMNKTDKFPALKALHKTNEKTEVQHE